MSYTVTNFKSKKAVKEAVASGVRVSVYQPNNIFGKEFNPGDRVFLEGPHYPQSHKWYAEATLGADCCIDKIK